MNTIRWAGERFFPSALASLIRARRALSLFCLLGILSAAVHSYFTPCVYVGHAELTCKDAMTDPLVVLPTESELRRLVYQQSSIERLLSDDGTDSPRDASDPAIDWTSRRIALTAISSHDSHSGVRRIDVPIHANSRTEAHSRLFAYLEHLQESFRKQQDMPISQVMLSQPTGLYVGTARGDSMLTAASAQVGEEKISLREWLDPEKIAIEQLAVEREARRLGVGLLNLAIAQQTLDVRWRELKDLEHLVEREKLLFTQALSELTKRKEQLLLPALVETKFPELADLRREAKEYRDWRTAMSANLTSSHPNIRILDRALTQFEIRLAAGVNEATAFLQAECDQRQNQLNEIGQQLKTWETRRAELDALSIRYSEVESRRLRFHEMTRDEKPSPPGPGQGPVPTTSMPPIPLLKTPKSKIGSILVTGPLIDRFPSEPALLTNLLLGGLVGFLTGCAIVLLWLCFDDTIHQPGDLQSGRTGVDVLAVIPTWVDAKLTPPKK